MKKISFYTHSCREFNRNLLLHSSLEYREIYNNHFSIDLIIIPVEYIDAMTLRLSRVKASEIY